VQGPKRQSKAARRLPVHESLRAVLKKGAGGKSVESGGSGHKKGKVHENQWGREKKGDGVFVGSDDGGLPCVCDHGVPGGGAGEGGSARRGVKRALGARGGALGRGDERSQFEGGGAKGDGVGAPGHR